MLLVLLHPPIAKSLPWEGGDLNSVFSSYAHSLVLALMLILILNIYEQSSDLSPLLLKHAAAPESHKRFKMG